MGRHKRKQTIDENINYFCKRNNIILTQKQKYNLHFCINLHSKKFSSKSKFYEYVKYFIQNNLHFWSQRLRRLSSMNLKIISKKKFLLLYGKDNAIKKWDNYINCQAKSNSFEYKKKKYGWTKDQYNSYNKLRAITIDNLIKKYGESEGISRYNEYIEKQKYSGSSLDYFIQKYGIVSGNLKYKNICASKANTLNNFMQRYGENLGRRKYRDYITARSNFYSKSSQELFWKINTKNCYFAEKNKEFGILSENQYYFYDFVDTHLKKCIEYNGDYWHCNPKIYNENYETHYGYSAKDIWEKDITKIEFIKSKGYDVMVVWESDYLKNSVKIVKLAEEFLNDKG